MKGNFRNSCDVFCFILLERSKCPRKMKKFVILENSKEGLTYHNETDDEKVR